tara:strand:- start:98 stop:505 length:408 start_codon:yes stop_codon:yes gene_type:complete
MSGSTVTSNALQFTNDNKNAYAYSGIIEVDNTETQLLLLNTQSEYLMAQLQILQGTDSNENFIYKVFFNDIIIAQWHCLQVTTLDINMPNSYELIIPPFTIVKVTALNRSSASLRDHSATLTAKVGMPQRVGNEA